MKSQSLAITGADRVTIRVLTDNYYDALRPDSRYARRYRSSPGRCIHAEHGLAFYIETESGGRSGACMFDFGLDPVGVKNNMDLFDINIGKANAFGLSHGHFDHFTGAAEILMRKRSGIKDGTPFYVGREAFLHRYSLQPGTDTPMDLGQLYKEDLEASGVKIHEVSDPMEMIPGGYISGDIERVTSYESPVSNLLVKRANELVPDDFPGEQALFFNVKDKGLVIISGCAHAGIVNTVRHVQNITGINEVHAVLGGFHLINAGQEKIMDTVTEMQSINPDIIVPLHCTGFEAVIAIRGALPDAFILNTAGTQYIFES